MPTGAAAAAATAATATSSSSQARTTTSANGASMPTAAQAQARPRRKSSTKANSSGNVALAQRKTEAEQARDLQRERERAAAREAQRELWERTRGAGSSVLALYDDDFRTRPIDSWDADDVLPSLEEVQTKKYDPVEVPSADLLLTRGISEYTVLPKVLGRGKFSTVFLAAKNGQKYAIKHTALFPHHPLISTRLLREPTLLAELPPHPNLVTVNETIRTPGHFYLVEEYLGGYVTLEALIPLLNKQPADQPAKLPDDAAEKVFQQLISVVNSIHTPLQICHRDIKPENILVHPVTLQLKLLDFGLATHFSRSEPKLSTCCGSPAFHCPEIVKALASPPGTVMYWGPEVDAWTCGITMLRCLTGVLYPLGAQHTSLRSMAIRAQRSVGMVTHAGLREKLAKLVDMDGVKRMRYFQEMNEEQERLMGEPLRERKDFKSTTYIPCEPSHTMKLPLLIGPAAEQAENLSATLRSPHTSSRNTPNTSRAPSPSALRHTHGLSSSPASGTRTMVLLNPTLQPPQRVLSFIKYCLRCAGVLYHCWPDAGSAASAPAMTGSMLPLSASSASVPELASAASASNGTRSNGSSEKLDISGLNVTGLAPNIALNSGASSSATNLTIPTTSSASNAFSHVHIFQCVLHLPEPVEEPEQQLSLVQTIMAAFGRKPAPGASNKRSLSQPPKPKTTDAASLGTEGSDKAAANAAAAANSGANNGKTMVRCLPFWMVIRFAKTNGGERGAGINGARDGGLTNGHHQRPGYARTSSTVGRRSRASSHVASAAAAGGGGGPANGAQETYSVRRGGNSLDLLEQATYAQASARTSMEATAESSAGEKVAGSAAAASVVSRPSGERQRSGSYSRVHSRQRLRSRVSHVSKPRIFIFVSDERALGALKKALSVGGTSEGSEAEDEIGLALVEGKEMDAGGGGEEKHPHPSLRNPNSPGFERKARPSVLRSQTFASATTHNGHVNATSASGGGVAFPSVGEGGEGSEVQQRGRPGAFAARRFESYRSVRTQSQAAVRPQPGSGSRTLTSEDLQRKLDALQSALRPVLTRSGRGRHGADGLATVEQARVNLAGLLQMLHDAERAHGPVLQAALSPITFQLFSVLTPVLGLEPIRTQSLKDSALSATRKSATLNAEGMHSPLTSPSTPFSSGPVSPIDSDGSEPALPVRKGSSSASSGNQRPESPTTSAPAAVAEPAPSAQQHLKLSASSSTDSLEEITPMYKMAQSALELAAQYSSARELFLAVQERLDLLIQQAASESNKDRSGGGEEEPGTPGTERKPAHARRPATKGWNAGLELQGLIGLLCILIPRIKTRKPHNFSESIASLLPRATKALLNQDSARRSPKQSDSKGGLSPSQQNAFEVLRSVIELARVTNAWEVKSLAEDPKSDSAMQSSTSTVKAPVRRSKDVINLFFGTVAALTPFLPALRVTSTGPGAGLSEAHFFSRHPKYALQRPESASPSSSPSLGTSAQEEALALWKDVGSLLGDFPERLVDTAFGVAVSDLPAAAEDPQLDGAAQAASTSIGAFLCLTQFLALEMPPSSELGVGPPASWTPEQAHGNLGRSVPILLAGLRSHATVKVGQDDDRPHAPIGPLEDAALIWILWCFDVLGAADVTDRALQPEVGIQLVQALSTNAALSASTARLISFLTVKQIILHHVSEQTAADLLFEIVAPDCPFPNLRSAGVGMIRDVIDFKLEQHNETTDAKASLPKPTEGVLTPEFLKRVNKVLFSLPAGFEIIKDCSTQETQLLRIRAFLDGNSSWLSECNHTLYYLVKRDQTNLTGIQDPALLEDLQKTYVAPLRQFITNWQTFTQQTQDENGERRQIFEGIAVSLTVISMGLDLVEGVLSRPADAAGQEKS
ncbi:hypothetical protein V8E36_004351 [Tilletia maclaganii]